MIKKSFSTVACMSANYIELAEACQKYHMSGIEIRMDNDGGICGFTEKSDLEKLQIYFAKKNVEITDLGSSVCFAYYNEEALDMAKTAIDMANIIGTKAIRVFLGYFAAKINHEKPIPDHDGIVQALKECCKYAEQKNIEVWIESHNEYATGKALKQLLSDVDCPNMKIIWDIMHPIEDGESIYETWDYVGSSIAHVHIKDGYDRKDAEWHDYCYTKLGEGELPLYEILDLLSEKGFDGYISFEWEMAWRGELKKYPDTFEFFLTQYNDFLKLYEKQKEK